MRAPSIPLNKYTILLGLLFLRAIFEGNLFLKGFSVLLLRGLIFWEALGNCLNSLPFYLHCLNHLRTCIYICMLGFLFFIFYIIIFLLFLLERLFFFSF
jgi:hypothetical protein